MSYDILNRQTGDVVELTQRDISVLYAAGIQKLWRLLGNIEDVARYRIEDAASPDLIHHAEMFNDLRDAMIKLSKLREDKHAWR